MRDGKYTDEFGNDFWFQDGQFHREDGPAVVYTNGEEYWFRHGNLLANNTMQRIKDQLKAYKILQQFTC